MKKMDLTRESFNSVKALLTKNRREMATKRQRKPVGGFSESHSSSTVCNPVKGRVTFPFASLSNDKETQNETTTIYFCSSANML